MRDKDTRLSYNFNKDDCKRYLRTEDIPSE